MRWVLLLLLAGCGLFGGGKPTPRYVIGEPYRLDGVWRYPREDFALTETALAAVYERRGLTANGETFDGGALAAAHPTLQLPALARVTNLENGRQIMVRVNDRGPDSAARSLGLTRHAAEAGADAALVLPPFFYKNPAAEGLISYFRRVLDAAALPVLLYSIPQQTSVPITDAVMVGLRGHPNLAGVKDSAGDWTRTHAFITLYPELRIFAGSDRLAALCYAHGGAGCISGGANA